MISERNGQVLLNSLRSIHTGRVDANAANVTCCCDWECSHWTQATTRELPANLLARVRCGLGLYKDPLRQCNDTLIVQHIPCLFALLSSNKEPPDEPCAILESPACNCPADCLVSSCRAHGKRKCNGNRKPAISGWQHSVITSTDTTLRHFVRKLQVKQTWLLLLDFLFLVSSLVNQVAEDLGLLRK